MASHDNERAFPRLDEEDLGQLAALATRADYADGEVVFKVGQADIDLFVVEAGRLDILNPTDGGRLVVSHGPGEFAGDIDMLTRRPVVVTAVARGDGEGGPTRLLRVPGQRLRQILNSVPRLSEKLLVAFQVRRQELQRAGVSGLRVVGPGTCRDTHLVREFLHKNFVPFTWTESESPEGRSMLAEWGNPRKKPIIDCAGQLLQCPSLRELAHCAGVWRECPEGEVDLAVVGAGPAGIAAAVYAASEGLKTVVLDRLGPGGQAGGSSRIENFIGFPAGLSGTDLATRGVLQMLKFGAKMVAPVNVDRLEFPADPADPAPHVLHLDCGSKIRARVVLATTGVCWRRLTCPGAEPFEWVGVHYACTAVEAGRHDGDDVAVVGGGNSAGQAAMFLAESCRDRTVHLLVRDRQWGAKMSSYLADRLRCTKNVKVHPGTEVAAVHGNGRLEQIELAGPGDAADGSPPADRPTVLPVRAVFVFIGAEPYTAWLPATVARNALGYVLTGTDAIKSGRWPLTHRDPCPLETTLPRVLAGGDLRAGSTKRVGFAVGDGSLAVTCAHALRAMPA